MGHWTAPSGEDFPTKKKKKKQKKKSKGDRAPFPETLPYLKAVLRFDVETDWSSLCFRGCVLIIHVRECLVDNLR